MTTISLDLLPLGRGVDPVSERGVDCPGDLPAASDPDLVARAQRAKAALGDQVFVLGHHYQRDEVIEFADTTGDSFKLAREAAARPDAPFIVFCGVHFMAESADILTGDDQQVVLPDLAAGCSMADMAAISQVEDCWDVLTDAGLDTSTVPVTYMNSTAAIKAFTGRHGGTVCTSSNAERALTWAFEQGERVLFLPDQHLGRNTAVLDLGLGLDDCVVYDPHKPGGGVTAEQLRAAKVVLWRGHCSVHGRFTVESVHEIREQVPGVTVLVHPECQHEVVKAADLVGSTEFIVHTLDQAEPGHGVGARHRAQPRPAARDHPPGADRHLPRPHRLLLLDDEPHRPAAPGVGAGEPRRGPRGQPHRRGRRGRALGPRRPRPDARAARTDRPPRLNPRGQRRPPASRTLMPVFKRRSSTATLETDAAADAAASGKGRPTPSRKDAEAAQPGAREGAAGLARRPSSATARCRPTRAARVGPACWPGTSATCRPETRGRCAPSSAIPSTAAPGRRAGASRVPCS